MNRNLSLAAIGVLIYMLVACSPISTLVSDENSRKPQATATKSLDTATRTQAPVSTKIMSQDTPTPIPALFPLSEPGPYFVGTRNYSVIDSSRGNREISFTVWYPALKSIDAEGRLIKIDAALDVSDAPYPMILTGLNSGNYIFRTHLASYGFVMVAINPPDIFPDLNFQVIDHPRDFLFVLDRITTMPLEEFEGFIDTERVGVGGYSWDGSISLALSGARINPEYYHSYCEQAATSEPISSWDGYFDYYCNLAKKWDEFSAHAGDETTNNDDGLWQPVTDDRILAVLPMAPDGAWLYGERGLGMADRPVLLIAPTKDEYTPYQVETAFIFEHLGSPQVSMVSFIGKDHMMFDYNKPRDQINHFATAFFGYYLQGKTEYRNYFSEEFVSQFDDLAWGLYEGDQ